MKKTPVIHPFLFSVHPILFLYSKNIASFPFRVITIPLLLVSIVAFILLSILSFTLRNKDKAGILASILLFSLLSYGHFSGLLGGSLGNLLLDALFLVLWFFLVALVAWYIIFFVKEAERATKILNTVACFLVATTVFNIGAYRLTNNVSVKTRRNSTAEGNRRQVLGESKTPPNIYYIILDGHGRSDILEEIYGYKNTELIDYLNDKGFYVASKSRSNYNATALSLASSLNLDYVQELIEGIDSDSNDLKPLNEIINTSEVVSTLKQWGYNIVTFSSGYYISDLKDANLYLGPENSLGEFENAVVNLTPISTVLSTFSLSDKFSVRALHRRVVLDTFEKLSDTSTAEPPAFIYAHIVSPHAPFVFGENGEELPINQSIKGWDGNHLVGVGGFTREDYVKYYGQQVMFLSKRVRSMIDRILSDSEQPPIIILQADHGPGSELDWESLENTNLKERFSILNAYYFPNKDYEGLYNSITPVNTFRVIFNNYFGTSYDLLKDENFFTTYSHPYKFINVSDKIRDEFL